MACQVSDFGPCQRLPVVDDGTDTRTHHKGRERGQQAGQAESLRKLSCGLVGWAHECVGALCPHGLLGGKHVTCGYWHVLVGG